MVQRFAETLDDVERQVKAALARTGAAAPAER
jgi:hypothetical protein